MPLPSAPASISLNQVNVELGLSGTATITLNDAAVRTLFGVPSGQISMSQGYGKASYWKNTTKGFEAGGATPANIATADRTTYSTETTAAVTGANLSQGRQFLAGAGNADKAFFSAGYNGSVFTATADRTTYSTEATAAVPGANLSQGRFRLGAAGNSTKGFFVGGMTPAAVATADRTTYSTETTAAVTGANLSQARGTMGSLGNADKAFFIGGGTSATTPFGPTATADRTTYSTEATAAVPGANLPAVRTFISNGAAGNSTKGFFAGGYNIPIFLATASRTTFSTETTSDVPGANLSQARYNSSGTGNDTKGFFCGGQVPGATVATADRTTYSTETTAAVTGANLSQARAWLAGA